MILKKTKLVTASTTVMHVTSERDVSGYIYKLVSRLASRGLVVGVVGQHSK